jgi:hypothetical protein
MHPKTIKGAISLLLAGGLTVGLAGCGGSSGGGSSDSSTDDTNVAGSCPVGVIADNKATAFGTDFPVCVLKSGSIDPITEDVKLTNDHIYVLDGSIHVGEGDLESVGQNNNSGSGGPTLTIEKGTMVMGRAGTSSHLVITRGADIEAKGTADQPIVFGAMKFDTSGNKVPSDADVTDLSGRGLWGGVIVSGWADVNDDDANNQLKSEARLLGDSNAYFGGTDDQDSSGTMEYVVIGESGYTIRPDEEIQGLTLEAVGSGTTINHLQVLGSDDDGVEWFGGTAGIDYVVINGASDDSLDMDNGFRGTVQYGILRQGSGAGNHGFETDGKSDSDAGDPMSNPTVANITVLGNEGGGETRGARHREGFQGDFYNIAYLDDTTAVTGNGAFTNGCLDLDNTADDQADTKPAYYGSICDSVAALYDDGKASDMDGSSDIVKEDGSVDTSSWAYTPAGQSAHDLSGVSGLETANYIGAVENSNDMWWDGWTVHHSYPAAGDTFNGSLKDADFHPLKSEIEGGTIAPASDS